MGKVCSSVLFCVSGPNCSVPVSAAESFAPLPDYSQQAGQAVTIFVLVVTVAVSVIVTGLGKPFTPARKLIPSLRTYEYSRSKSRGLQRGVVYIG